MNLTFFTEMPVLKLWTESNVLKSIFTYSIRFGRFKVKDEMKVYNSKRIPRILTSIFFLLNMTKFSALRIINPINLWQSSFSISSACLMAMETRMELMEGSINTRSFSFLKITRRNWLSLIWRKKYGFKSSVTFTTLTKDLISFFFLWNLILVPLFFMDSRNNDVRFREGRMRLRNQLAYHSWRALSVLHCHDSSPKL